MDIMDLVALGSTGLAVFDAAKPNALIGRALRDLQELHGADYWFDLGDKARKAKEYNRAMDFYRKALQVDPDHEATLFWLGYCYIPSNCRLGTEKELYDLDVETCARRAVRCYERLLWIRRRHGPLGREDSAALNNLAVAYGNLKETDKEERTFREAMELNPEDPVCCCNVGVVLREKGKTLEAMGYFKKALKVDPGYVNGLFNLARAEDELGYKADAVEHYRRYLDTVDRTDPWERDLVKLAVAAVDRLRN